MIEEQATRAQGLELTIQMDSGKTLSIVQEVDSVNAFAKGQRVRVLTQGALARVSPEWRCQVHASDRGIQIENPDLVRAWDTPVGL